MPLSLEAACYTLQVDLSLKRLRLGVIYGGRSSEHEVSLASAAAIFANLDSARYEALPIRIDRRGRWSLEEYPPTTLSAAAVITQPTSVPNIGQMARETHFVAAPTSQNLVTIERNSDGGSQAVVAGLSLDVVFPVIHGPYGEDGTLQGLLELANVPYVGAGVLASAVAMDKAVAKVLFSERGLPQVDYAVVNGAVWDRDHRGTLDRLVAKIPFPVFVKPANLGSSVGVSKASDRAALEQAVELARAYDQKIIVEATVPDARELECAVLGNDAPEASVPGEIVPSREFYDYASKYLDEGSELVIPARLETPQTEQIRSMAVEAFRAVNAAGMARVDFLMAGASGRIVVNEINTVPGFTTISMFAKLWQASGLEYSTLLNRLIELAQERHAAKQQLRTGSPL